MIFDFIQTISESKLIPNRKNLHDFDYEKLAELAFINILSLRILLEEDELATFAQQYCRKTAQWGNFKTWRSDSTDIYVTLYGLISDEAKNDKKYHYPRIFMPIDALLMYRWLRAGADQRHDKSLTHRLFVQLDTMFRIKDSSMRAIRRLVMDWDTITTEQRKLALTRLLQFMRTRAAKGELLPKLNRVAVLKNLEIQNVDNPETGEKREVKENLLLTLETASAGATGAASVATAVGTLGAGFDNDFSKSIYPKPKKKFLLHRITEKFEEIEISHFGQETNKVTIKVLVNPTLREAQAFLKRTGKLRGLYSETNKCFYLWSAYIANHNDIFAAIGEKVIDEVCIIEKEKKNLITFDNHYKFDNYIVKWAGNIKIQLMKLFPPNGKLTETIEITESEGNTLIANLSEDEQKIALAAFAKLANSQRGKPEILATSIKSNQGLFHGTGAFTFLCEHIGDLSNRMSQTYCEQMGYGYEMVAEKVRKTIKYFNQYDIRKELADNLTNNYNYDTEEKKFTGTFEEYKKQFEMGAKRYGMAHSELVVYNEAQYLAKTAAVSLGLLKFDMTGNCLSKLQNVLKQGVEEWIQFASQVILNNGQPVEFQKLNEMITESTQTDSFEDAFYAEFEASEYASISHVNLHSYDNNKVEINHIGVDQGHRGKGIGNALMTMLTRLADEYGIILYASPATDADGEEGLDYHGLRDWYERWNFEKLPGLDNMRRDPTKEASHLTEIFQQPSKLDWDLADDYNSDAKLIQYLIKLPNGRNYVVTIKFIGIGMWTVSFMLRDRIHGVGVSSWTALGLGGSDGVTGTGNASHVFNAVFDCLKHFVNTRHPKGLFFTAKQESRKKLYDILSKKMAAIFGWVVTSYETEHDGRQYVLSAKP